MFEGLRCFERFAPEELDKPVSARSEPVAESHTAKTVGVVPDIVGVVPDIAEVVLDIVGSELDIVGAERGTVGTEAGFFGIAARSALQSTGTGRYPKELRAA